jgi:hypothetical protein
VLALWVRKLVCDYNLYLNVRKNMEVIINVKSEMPDSCTLDNMAMVNFFGFVQKLNSANLANLRLIIKDTVCGGI